MLARANRVIAADDYRTVLRKGRRIKAASTAVYVLQARREGPARFGFVVTRKVGNAVNRNLVRRRLKASAFQALGEVPAGTDVVVRVLPNAGEYSWATLNGELVDALNRSRG